jgi:hypothetical protein
MAAFTITDGQVTVGGVPVACTAFTVDTTGDRPALTLHGVTTDITGDGVIVAVREPGIEEVAHHAADMLERVTGSELAELVKPRLRDGRIDPYAATIQALVEVLRG